VPWTIKLTSVGTLRKGMWLGPCAPTAKVDRFGLLLCVSHIRSSVGARWGRNRDGTVDFVGVDLEVYRCAAGIFSQGVGQRRCYLCLFLKRVSQGFRSSACCEYRSPRCP